MKMLKSGTDQAIQTRTKELSINPVVRFKSKPNRTFGDSRLQRKFAKRSRVACCNMQDTKGAAPVRVS